MSFCTDMRASFALDVKQPTFYKFRECAENALKRVGLIGEQDEIVKVSSGWHGNSPRVGDVVRALGTEDAVWSAKVDAVSDVPLLLFNVQKENGNIERLAFPMVPMPPQGSEEPPFVSHAFCTREGWYDSIDVSFYGSMRDFCAEETPYIDFFFEYLSALTGSDILYSYSSTWQKRQNKFASTVDIEDDDLAARDERVVDTLAFYFKTYTDWSAAVKRGDGVEDDDPYWRGFVLERLKERQKPKAKKKTKKV